MNSRQLVESGVTVKFTLDRLTGIGYFLKNIWKAGVDFDKMIAVEKFEVSVM